MGGDQHKIHPNLITHTLFEWLRISAHMTYEKWSILKLYSVTHSLLKARSAQTKGTKKIVIKFKLFADVKRYIKLTYPLIELMSGTIKDKTISKFC